MPILSYAFGLLCGCKLDVVSKDFCYQSLPQVTWVPSWTAYGFPTNASTWGGEQRVVNFSQGKVSTNGGCWWLFQRVLLPKGHAPFEV